MYSSLLRRRERSVLSLLMLCWLPPSFFAESNIRCCVHSVTEGERCWSSDEWIGSHRSRATQIQFQKHHHNLSECQRSSLVSGFFKIQLVFNYSWWKNRHRPSSNLSSTPESASNGSSGQIAQCDGSMAMVQINSSSRSLPTLFWSQGKKEETKTLAHQDE